MRELDASNNRSFASEVVSSDNESTALHATLCERVLNSLFLAKFLDFQGTAVEISRMTDLIRMQFLALHARMMKDKHQRMKERGFYKVSVAKRTVIRQCKA